jgi:signal transduction histidine kinase
MGNHGVASARLRAGKTSQSTKGSTSLQVRSPRALTMRDWPVSWRLIAVIVLALVMGLVFGGLRVAAAAGSAAQFGRVSQLASLGQQVTGLVQALQDERDQTTGIIPAASAKDANAALQQWYQATDASAAKVKVLAAGIGGSFPANIQSRVATVLSVITHLNGLRTTAQASQSALAVIADYSGPIGDMISLNNQMAEGTADSGLASSVQALNSLSLAKDEAAQQRAILYNALTQQLFADGELQALTTSESKQGADLTAFGTTVSPAEQLSFRNTVAGSRVNAAELIEEYVTSLGTTDLAALHISPGAAPREWYSTMSDTVDKMQGFELGLANSIVARSQSLQRNAEASALFNAVLTVIILLLVLVATLAVARSLVRPLRRLREGALDIATVQLPERVRLLGEAVDPATSLEVAPIDVLSADEIGQVARAFDQVHAEAVRLAGNEAMLRSSFNAMFVNLSRRSQSLIERLARMIDSLEQNEADPDRLSNLFSMDHLVTRMRRNSENLLLLAGHETARKRSEPVPLADVARAATSEIEQYSRVTLKIQPGVSVIGQAVSDVVHLLAEIVENATIFSPKDTPVHVSAQELTSGGVLIEVSDSGVGIPEARLTEMNWRLDNPPVMDVSVSRHMGLFAVARLAERHGVRARLRARSPRGLVALVWLPDSIIERGNGPSLWPGGRLGRQAAAAVRRTSGGQGTATHSAADGQSANDRLAAVTSAPTAGVPREPVQAAVPREPVQAAVSAASDWFRNPRPSATGATSNGGTPPGAALPSAGGRLSGTGPSGTGPSGTGPSAAGGWAQGKHAAQIIADPVRGDQTAAGLPVRIPRANLLPGSAGGGQRAGSGATSRPEGSREGQTTAAARPPRSPELARNRLSGFQRGGQRGKAQAPRAGEEADR